MLSTTRGMSAARRSFRSVRSVADMTRALYGPGLVRDVGVEVEAGIVSVTCVDLASGVAALDGAGTAGRRPISRHPAAERRSASSANTPNNSERQTEACRRRRASDALTPA